MPAEPCAFCRQLCALEALKRLGPKARGALPAIMPLLRDTYCVLPAPAVFTFVEPQREEEILSLTNVLGLRGTSGLFQLGPETLHAYAMFKQAANVAIASIELEQVPEQHQEGVLQQ